MYSKRFITIGLALVVAILLIFPANAETYRSVLKQGDKLGYGQEFPLPGQKGSLVIDLPGFEFLGAKVSGDIEEILVAKRGTSKDERFFIQMRISMRPYSIKAVEFRDGTLKSLMRDPDIKFLKKFEEGQMAFLHLFYNELNHMLGFVCREDIPIEIHVMGEEKGALEILRSVRFKGR